MATFQLYDNAMVVDLTAETSHLVRARLGSRAAQAPVELLARQAVSELLGGSVRVLEFVPELAARQVMTAVSAR